LRPLERTFPFSSVGEDFAAADFLEAFAMPQSVTPPFRALYGKDAGWRYSLRSPRSSRSSSSVDELGRLVSGMTPVQGLQESCHTVTVIPHRSHGVSLKPKRCPPAVLVFIDASFTEMNQLNSGD
jgi:hypothetical protein